jgi:hypothetical protein
MTRTAGNRTLSRVTRSTAGTVSALALVGGLVAVISPAQASEPVTTTSTTAQAGYLDRTFAGGAGYRTIPKPQDAQGRAWGVDLAVSPSGLIRTLSRHDIRTPGASGSDRAVLRSWTSNGWIDRAFAAGKPTNLGVFNGEGGIGFAGPPSQAVTTIEGFAGAPIILKRYGQDGHRLVRKTIGQNDFSNSFDYVILANGTSVTCDAWSDMGSPAVLVFRTAADKVLAKRTLPGSFDCNLSAAGSSVWHWDRDLKVITRIGIDATLDTRWGGDGSVQTNVVLWRGFQAQPDGSLYAWGKKKIGASWVQGVARFTPSGAPDLAFGTAGFASIGGAGTILSGRTVNADTWSIGPRGMVLSLDVQATRTGAHRYRLIRLTKAGKLDATFGSGGIIQTTTPTTALAHDSRGRILTLNSSATGTVTLARRGG